MADQPEFVTLTLTLSGDGGKTLASPLVIYIEKRMSKKIAKLHVADMFHRTSPATMDTALAALGLK